MSQILISMPLILHNRDCQRILDAKGLIHKGNYSGWYSVTDECFYTDAQVSQISENGTSKMTSLETGSAVDWQEETNYMLRLSEFQSALLDHYKATNIIFPSHHQSHILDILSEPLEDLSISRPQSRLSWGVQVPTDPDQTVYVWFDALLSYLSGLQYPWNTTIKPDLPATCGWPVDLQVIGKDILRCVVPDFRLPSTEVNIQGQFPRHIFPCDAAGFRLAVAPAVAIPRPLDSRAEENVEIIGKYSRSFYSCRHIWHRYRSILFSSRRRAV